MNTGRRWRPLHAPAPPPDPTRVRAKPRAPLTSPHEPRDRTRAPARGLPIPDWAPTRAQGGRIASPGDEPGNNQAKTSIPRAPEYSDNDGAPTHFRKTRGFFGFLDFTRMFSLEIRVIRPVPDPVRPPRAPGGPKIRLRHKPHTRNRHKAPGGPLRPASKGLSEAVFGGVCLAKRGVRGPKTDSLTPPQQSGGV